MAERPKRRPARSAPQTRLKQLEKRLAHLENQLKTLRTEASGSVGATRARLESLERRAAAQLNPSTPSAARWPPPKTAWNRKRAA
jgi:uncharacterized coiled-coil protein SlyX